MERRQSTYKQEVDTHYDLVVQDILGYLTPENRQKWDCLAETCRDTLCYLWIEGRVDDYMRRRRMEGKLKNIRIVLAIPATVDIANWINGRVQFVHTNGGIKRDPPSFLHKVDHHPPSAA